MERYIPAIGIGIVILFSIGLCKVANIGFEQLLAVLN